MKRNALALSVAAAVGTFGLAGAASADVITDDVTAVDLVRNNNRTGHVLISPYFSTQSGNLTTLHIVNTDTQNGKAVKVRFRSAANSDDVFDFQILMSPGDVWTGGVIADGDTGLSKMVTADSTCTVPAQINGLTFPTARLPEALKGPEEIAAMTREGYIEILNMADIGKDVGDGDLYTATKHGAGGTAPTCDSSVIGELTKNPTSKAEANALGLTNPSGGLFANTAIINVPNTSSYSGQAAALVASTDADKPVPGLANIVFYPQTADSAGNVDNATADPLLRSTDVLDAKKAKLDASALPLLGAAMYDLPDLSTPYTQAAANPLAQADSLTTALGVGSVVNEFNVEPGLEASTDWVFSMPTRRYHVAMDYEAAARGASDGRVFTPQAPNGTELNTHFNATNTVLDETDKTRICVASQSITMFDREEDTKRTGFVISPGTTTSVNFCGETSVLSFQLQGTTNNPSVLGSTIANQSIETPYQNGWANLITRGNAPVLGAAYIKLVNHGARAGVSGNYGLVYPHR